jgi:NhaD family Na+/H+ antiporter
MEILIACLFVAGYVVIAFEHPLKVNKAAAALITGALCWTVYVLSGASHEVVGHQLAEHLSEIAGILFFLLGAMTIVEIMDAHDGFETISERIKTTDKRKLLWLISFIAFSLSAVLDNLTTTIVMVSLIRKLVPGKEDRLFFAGMIVIAANAGGAFSPIGDVTTTMLWIGGQISTFSIIGKLFIPSLVCILTPLLILSVTMKGEKLNNVLAETDKEGLSSSPRERLSVFLLGIGALLFTPVFKTFTHLPPYMGILLGLGVIWVWTDLMHKAKEDDHKRKLSVLRALERIDTPSILFFLGILVTVAALESVGILPQLAQWMDKSIGNESVIAISIGLLSAVVDNVPLVAAAMGMYSLDTYPMDSYFWEFLAYTAGTGGSILIIGSAAGVAAMGMEKIDFMWYLKRISLLALLGYLAGAFVYILQYQLFS